ncbi:MULTISPECIES: ABC transporter permease [Lysinibacillus]|jgi:multidrug/hemolysin transport system permease protein|uniref:ABC transporter permease n=1 Tax=Lysinibacillus TaxID=400634 RepID=UPI0004D64696|nr:MULTISPECIES: ABC transporter permease [Lysinibacillus]MDC6269011.1 ABC transporter permease [Lysinibacillus sphaericus]AJK88708.1 transporter [Lysinibacillus fusiformis]KGA83094.1 transporter [Lysinibacillus fusiformis]KHK55256.1 transporter [Lysinibacillus sp. A1]MDN4969805.1 ABC transporter permease [Lysinibacillus fusiformis]
MEALMSLVQRNSKVFRRDKTQVFFSLLSVIIVIVLYAVFLQKMQVDAIERITEATPEVITMVNEWVVAGLLSMIAVSTTLGAYGIAIKDQESKAMADFLTAPLSRATIQMSYVLNALIIGSIFSFIALIGCEIFIVATGGKLLSLTHFVQVLGIILLSVLLASVLNLFLSLFVSTQNAFSTLGTIVGTLLGFLCGVYVPLGALPSFAQNLIMYFPVSHTTLLLRNTFMESSITNVFEGTPVSYVNDYKINYGIVYELHGNTLSASTSILIIVGTILILAIASLLLFKRKYK